MVVYQDEIAVGDVVLYTDIGAVKGDDKGRISVRTTGTGKGLFLCDGVVQEIQWSRADKNQPMQYLDASGQPLKLGVGHSYINVVDSPKRITVEETVPAEDA